MIGQTASMMRQAALTQEKVKLELEMVRTRILHEMEGGMQDELTILQAQLDYLEHQLEVVKMNVQMEMAENMELMGELGEQMAQRAQKEMEKGLYGDTDEDVEEQGGEAQA